MDVQSLEPEGIIIDLEMFYKEVTEMLFGQDKCGQMKWGRWSGLQGWNCQKAE